MAMYDARILSEVQQFVPSGFKLRPLEESDYEKGFLKCLADLTQVGPTKREDFLKRFKELSSSGGYYVTVVEDTTVKRIVASGTVFVEPKFIRSLGKVAHIEDIVVHHEYRKHQLGRLIIRTLQHIARATSCYKVILDCEEKNVGFYEKCGFERKGAEMDRGASEHGSDRSLPNDGSSSSASDITAAEQQRARSVAVLISNLEKAMKIYQGTLGMRANLNDPKAIAVCNNELTETNNRINYLRDELAKHGVSASNYTCPSQSNSAQQQQQQQQQQKQPGVSSDEGGQSLLHRAGNLISGKLRNPFRSTQAQHSSPSQSTILAPGQASSSSAVASRASIITSPGASSQGLAHLGSNDAVLSAPRYSHSSQSSSSSNNSNSSSNESGSSTQFAIYPTSSSSQTGEEFDFAYKAASRTLPPHLLDLLRGGPPPPINLDSTLSFPYCNLRNSRSFVGLSRPKIDYKLCHLIYKQKVEEISDISASQKDVSTASSASESSVNPSTPPLNNVIPPLTLRVSALKRAVAHYQRVSSGDLGFTALQNSSIEPPQADIAVSGTVVSQHHSGLFKLHLVAAHVPPSIAAAALQNSKSTYYQISILVDRVLRAKSKIMRATHVNQSNGASIIMINENFELSLSQATNVDFYLQECDKQGRILNVIALLWTRLPVLMLKLDKSSGKNAVSVLPEFSITDWFALDPVGMLLATVSFSMVSGRSASKLGRNHAVLRARRVKASAFGHVFVLRSFATVMKCGLCSEFIGMSSCYVCSYCKLACHKKCSSRVLFPCRAVQEETGENDASLKPFAALAAAGLTSTTDVSKTITGNQQNATLDEKRQKSEPSSVPLIESRLPDAAISAQESTTAATGAACGGASSEEAAKLRNLQLRNEKLEHSIPHKFAATLNLSASWCALCGIMLSIGRGSVKCNHCDVLAHSACAKYVPEYCGLTMKRANKMLEEIQRANAIRAHGGSPANRKSSGTQAAGKRHSVVPQSRLSEAESDAISVGSATSSLSATVAIPVSSSSSFSASSSAAAAAAAAAASAIGILPASAIQGESASANRKSTKKRKHDSSSLFDAAFTAREQRSFEMAAAASAGKQNLLTGEAIASALNAATSGTPPVSGPIVASQNPPILRKKLGPEHFRFVSVLGKGNFGKVMLSQEVETGRYFAIKVLKKEFVIENDEIESSRSERRIFQAVTDANHPFLVKLYASFQSATRLYFVMEYIAGGDLMMHIQRELFSEDQARFYAVEVLLALEFFHENKIVYRDLKLDNIMLCVDGHLKIADYGLCKENVGHGDFLNTFCGTPEFMAPEILAEANYTRAVDWWAFGVLVFEMLTGHSPFPGETEDEIFQLIRTAEPGYPSGMSGKGKSLCQRLLVKDPLRRLGSSVQDAAEIKKHEFFEGVDWAAYLKKQVRAPYVPIIAHATDTTNFDAEFTNEPPTLTPTYTMIDESDQREFDTFSYQCETFCP